MANFHLQCSYIEIKVPKIEILSEILEEKDIDNQMFTILGLEEPLFRLKYSDFSCVIVLYLLSFFYDHPVESSRITVIFLSSESLKCIRKS